MTLTLELPPDQEKQLARAADEQGMDVPTLALALIAEGLSSKRASIVPKDDWEREFIEYPRRHPPIETSLSDEHLRRENLYEECP
jgi:hypothetical protein